MSNHPHSKIKSIFVVGIFFNCLMWITLTLAQAAETSEQPVMQEPAVTTFTVAPVQRTSAILMPNAQTPEPPALLDSKTKSGILKNLGGSAEIPAPGDIKAPSKPVLEHLLLSARQPFFSEQGFLTLALAYAVHPETAIKFNSNYPGSAGLKLKVEKGHTYLLDFAVRSGTSGTYRVQTESGKQEFDDTSASKDHLLVALKATSSGWTTVRLSRDGTEYHLYYVEVTRVP